MNQEVPDHVYTDSELIDMVSSINYLTEDFVSKLTKLDSESLQNAVESNTTDAISEALGIDEQEFVDYNQLFVQKVEDLKGLIKDLKPLDVEEQYMVDYFVQKVLMSKNVDGHLFGGNGADCQYGSVSSTLSISESSGG